MTLDEASLNLSRTDRQEGGVQWNFASLAGATMKDKLPSIHVRGGRVNFKSGDIKSVFYLLDTDIDMYSTELDTSTSLVVTASCTSRRSPTSASRESATSSRKATWYA